MLETFIVIVDPELSQENFDSFLKSISPEKRDRLSHFRFFKDARNTLIGDILIRMKICMRTGLKNNRLIFSKTEYGKPFLLNDRQIYFNISHAGNCVAAAIDNKPVGIDIEIIKPTDMKIAGRFFASDEKEYVHSQPSPDLRYKAFFEIWTKKESNIKWEGLGLSKPLSSFSVLSTPNLPPYYHCVFVNDEAVCHVCTEQREPPECKMVTISELLNTDSK